MTLRADKIDWSSFSRDTVDHDEMSAHVGYFRYTSSHSKEGLYKLQLTDTTRSVLRYVMKILNNGQGVEFDMSGDDKETLEVEIQDPGTLEIELATVYADASFWVHQ